MIKKMLILVMALVILASLPVFADDTVNTADPGIKPDSPLYILDRLAEKIQIALITDAVKEAEALAAIAQERLAESKAMVEDNNVEKASAALNDYKKLMNDAVNIIDTAAKDGKAVAAAIDKLTKYDTDNEELLEKLMNKVPEEYKEELNNAIESLPEANTVKSEDEEEENEEQAVKASAILTGKIEDKALLEKIQAAGLNNRQLSALISISEQSGKELSQVLELFLTNSKGIGKTIIDLDLAPKNAMKDINKTFKELKKEIKSGISAAESEENDSEAREDELTEDKDEDITDEQKAEKLEKKLEKAAEKLEKKIEKTEKKLSDKLKNAEDKAKNDEKYDRKAGKRN